MEYVLCTFLKIPNHYGHFAPQLLKFNIFLGGRIDPRLQARFTQNKLLRHNRHIAITAENYTYANQKTAAACPRNAMC